MNTKGNSPKKMAMLKALEKTLGNVSESATVVGISRKTHYQWLKEDKEYKEQVDSIAESAIDFVEGKLFELIAGAKRTIATKGGIKTIQDPPNAAAVFFFLKCRAKQRGYVERYPTDQDQPVTTERTRSIIDLGSGVSIAIG